MEFLKKIFSERKNQVLESVARRGIPVNDMTSLDKACTDYALAYYRREKYRQILEVLSRTNFHMDKFLEIDQADTEPGLAHVL